MQSRLRLCLSLQGAPFRWFLCWVLMPPLEHSWWKQTRWDGLCRYWVMIYLEELKPESFFCFVLFCFDIQCVPASSLESSGSHLEVELNGFRYLAHSMLNPLMSLCFLPLQFQGVSEWFLLSFCMMERSLTVWIDVTYNQVQIWNGQEKHNEILSNFFCCLLKLEGCFILMWGSFFYQKAFPLHS